MKSGFLRIATAAAFTALVSLPCAAAVTLRDKPALEDFLKNKVPCCVIDARSDKSRKAAPLANTLAYRKGLKINPTGVVVIVADTDAKAIEIGEILAARSKAKEVYAVQGGASTWQAVTEGSIFSGMPRSFVIPKNTCEQGTPLQELLSQ